MRIISKARLKEFWEQHSHAHTPLQNWYKISKDATWRSFTEVRQLFRSVDTARVASGNMVTIFNIGGNKYRLIAAIHYNQQTLYVLRVLTHSQYDINRWKEEL